MERPPLWASPLSIKPFIWRFRALVQLILFWLKVRLMERSLTLHDANIGLSAKNSAASWQNAEFSGWAIGFANSINVASLYEQVIPLRILRAKRQVCGSYFQKRAARRKDRYS
jgi:hypothetical protein